MTRVDELTARLLDGTLSDGEWVELESLLVTDPDGLAAHVAILELEGVLRGLRTGFDLSKPTLTRVKEAQAEKTTQAVMAEIASQSAPEWMDGSHPATVSSSRRRWLLMASGLIVVAAALLLGLWLGGGPADPERPGENGIENPLASLAPGFARLTSSHGSVELLTPQGEVMPITEGREVPPGHTLQTVGEDSLARVEMPDRTIVDVESNSVVRFVAVTGTATSKPRLFLAKGQLTAAVPEGVTDRQLVVGTGVAEVFGRKGTFIVASTGPESARVDVKQGNVEVVRMDARTRVPVGKGSAIVQVGFEKVYLEPAVRIDHVPTRRLPFPGPRDAVFSPDGHEVWIASPRQFTRWTRDGGTADVHFPPRKGGSNGPIALFTRDRSTLITSVASNKEEKLLLRLPPGGEDGREINLHLSEARLWTVAPSIAWFATTDPKPHHKRLRVFDGFTGAERLVREFDEVVGCLAAKPDGHLLAAGLTDPGRGTTRVILLDPATGERQGALATQKKGLVAMSFSADGRHLAVGFNGLVQVWDVRSRELVKSISGFERVVTCLAFAPGGNALAAGTQDGQVWVWSVGSGKPVQLIEIGSRGVRSLAFSPDGKRLVSVANNTPVMIWDVAEIPSEPAGNVQ